MINFLKYRLVAGFLSCVLLAITIGAYIYRGGFKYSVDFTGGTQLLLGFKDPVNSEQLKDVLKEGGFVKNVSTRDFSPTEILIRVPEFENDAKGLSEQIQKIVQAALPNNEVRILSIDSVGGGVGASLRWNFLKAIALAVLLILLYIALRFKFAFAVGAIIALLHDAVAIPGFFLIFDKEISVEVIGAILAILGYSINDTIVIFARIRENITKMHGQSLNHIVNVSLNQTLRRTVLTSVATALVVLALLIFGGQALRDLSLTLLIGIIVGTFSSIYIASPIMLLLNKDIK